MMRPTLHAIAYQGGAAMSIGPAGNAATDKATVHQYMPFYDSLFARRRDDKLNLLEVGVQGGGSLYVWQEYFRRGQILGIDILHARAVLPASRAALDWSRVTLFAETDAYSEAALDAASKHAPGGFDVIIDDGPHTLESQRWMARHYPRILAPGGVLIIEDIDGLDNARAILAELDTSRGGRGRIVDLRSKTNPRFDDILVVFEAIPGTRP